MFTMYAPLAAAMRQSAAPSLPYFHILNQWLIDPNSPVKRILLTSQAMRTQPQAEPGVQATMCKEFTESQLGFKPGPGREQAGGKPAG
jgi:hypothetical protein